MKKLAAVLVLAATLLTAPASGQYVGEGVMRTVANSSPTPCTDGAADLSLTTGCNMILFHGGFF